MEYNEIIKLLDAGYSREEIMAMQKEPEPTPEPAPEPEPTPELTDGVMSNLVNEMRDAFNEMKKEFIAFNIMASKQPEEKTPEDIIANIINPTRPKKKGE